MAAIFANQQLQPYEENQSPSPIDEIDNPFDRSLSRSVSPHHSVKPSSPTNTTNNLHRRLSSASPESPPPAWNRRPSMAARASRNAISTSPPPRLPSASEVPPANNSSPASRRHPGMLMTSNRVPMLGFEDSPCGSATELEDGALPHPNAPFRKRPSSNRSSLVSQDISSLTSEELWNLEQEGVLPDMSNPTRQADERPLDTVRRISMRMEHSQSFHNGLREDLIWPSAPSPEDVYSPPIKSKSGTNIGTLTASPPKRIGRRRTSRQVSLEIPYSSMPAMPGKMVDGNIIYAKSMPTSPVENPPRHDVIVSSAHSSSTSLNSQMPSGKSVSAMGNRPPSAFYSRDFLTALAPREGGYAIAAQMGSPQVAAGGKTPEERRRSTPHEEMRSRGSSRAPMARSAGMGRWSLDGGEHYPGRPYGTPSLSTTASNLSAPPINSPDPSPPTDPISSRGSLLLPEGALVPTQHPLDTAVPVLTTSSSSVFTSYSPIGHQSTPNLSVQSSAPVPSPSEPSSNKSKRMLAKEAKAAEKLGAQEMARQRKEAVKQAQLEKQTQRDAEVKAKEEAKRKEKEEKAQTKAEGKAKKLQSSSTLNLPSPFKRSQSDVPPVPPMPPSFAEARQRTMSMPLDAPAASNTQLPSEQGNMSKPKVGMLGTFKKRFSMFGKDGRDLDTPPKSNTSASLDRSGPTSVPPTPPRSDLQSPVVIIDGESSTSRNDSEGLPRGLSTPLDRDYRQLPKMNAAA